MKTRRLATRPFAVGFNVKRMTHGFKVPASAFDRNTQPQPPSLVRSGAPSLQPSLLRLAASLRERDFTEPSRFHLWLGCDSSFG